MQESTLFNKILFISNVMNENFIFIMLMYGDEWKHLTAIH